MEKSFFLTIALFFVFTFSNAQTTAMQFSGVDCNGNNVDLFADLDSGKAVVLFYFMPNCGSCPPPAKRIQAMANNINSTHPGMVKGYAFPYQNSTSCTYSAGWVSSNNLSALYAPMDSGATQVAHYGGFGMPTVVLVAGADHRVLFSSLSFSTSDTTQMRDSILALIETPSKINDITDKLASFSLFPNPATDVVSLNMQLKETSNLKVEVLDAAGKQVALVVNERVSGGVTRQLNTASLPNGIYLVQIKINEATLSRKLTIAH